MSRAQLPMYDWPEVRVATDALWQHVRQALLAVGFAPPRHLDRATDPRKVWPSDDLLLGQTCGLPLTRHLSDRVQVLGAFDFDLKGCAAGWYDSVLITRQDDSRSTLSAFEGAHLAINGPDSQSGCQCMMYAVHQLGAKERFFGAVTTTGAHEASARHVASGQCDIAALDHVSWRLTRAHRSFARDLKVVGTTVPTPGLPLITSRSHDANTLRGALTRALQGVPADLRKMLGIAGFQPLQASDYNVIAAQDAASRDQAVLHGVAQT